MGLLPCYMEIQKKTSCRYKKKGRKSKKKERRTLKNGLVTAVCEPALKRHSGLPEGGVRGTVSRYSSS